MSRLGDLIVVLIIAMTLADPGGAITTTAPWLTSAVRQAERAAGVDALHARLRRILPY